MLEGPTRQPSSKLLIHLISQLIALLQRDSSRAFIARGIVRWLENRPEEGQTVTHRVAWSTAPEMVTDAR